jgi:hypothetical protein
MANDFAITAKNLAKSLKTTFISRLQMRDKFNKKHFQAQRILAPPGFKSYCSSRFLPFAPTRIILFVLLA